MSRTPIHTDAAPAAIGTYSQAIRHNDTVYVSGQIPLDPATGELVSAEIGHLNQKRLQHERTLTFFKSIRC